MHKSFNDIVAERRAKMTPEMRAHSDGYQMGYRDAFDQWEAHLVHDSLWTIVKNTLSIRKRINGSLRRVRES